MRHLIFKGLLIGFLSIFSLTAMAQVMTELDNGSTGIPSVIEKNIIPGPSGGETYEFILTVNDPVFANYQNVRFFWYFGDGEYLEYMGSFKGTPVSRVIHTFYGPVGPNNNFPLNDLNIEITGGDYDELDPPRRASFKKHGQQSQNQAFATACTGCGLNLANQSGGINSDFFITTNRNLVSDQQVTYILTVANNCGESAPVSASVEFKFNPNLLKPEDVTKPGIALGTNSFVDNSNSTDGQYNWTVIDLDHGETQNIFIRMIVQPSLPFQSSIPVNAEVNFQTNTGCPTNKNIPFPGFVDNSHDPNNLTSEMTVGCPNLQGDSIRYTIRFRNDGNGAADSVIIKTIIPDVFNPNSIEVIYPTHLNGIIVERPTTVMDSGKKLAQWVLQDQFLKNGNTLRGTKEREFGSRFFADATIDSLVFDVYFKSDYEPKSCEAIVNQAEIIFDCNPSFYTGPYIYRFDCVTSFQILTDSTGVNDTIPICESCAENVDFSTAIAQSTGSGSQILLANYDASKIIHPLTSTYAWYPSWNLTNSIAAKPIAKPKKGTEYFMVASSADDCSRTIFRYPVEMPCNLEIVPTVVCNIFGGKEVLASVLGNYTSGSLKWNDCNFSDTYASGNINISELYLTVVDVSNNCSAEILVDMTQCNAFNWNPIYIGGGILLLLLGAWFFRR